MEFKNRKAQYPNRKRIQKVDSVNNPIPGEMPYYVQITNADGATSPDPLNEGTALTAEKLTQFSNEKLDKTARAADSALLTGKAESQLNVATASLAALANGISGNAAANQYYGTNSENQKGFFNLPSGSGSNIPGPAGPQGPQGDQGPAGPQGPKGDPGTAAGIQIGSVTTLPPGSQAYVTNTGSSANAIFNFGIPRGASGDGGGGTEVQNEVIWTGMSPSISLTLDSEIQDAFYAVELGTYFEKVFAVYKADMTDNIYGGNFTFCAFLPYNGACYPVLLQRHYDRVMDECTICLNSVGEDIFGSGSDFPMDSINFFSLTKLA